MVKTLIDAKEGTNADQIKALKAVIDSIGGMTGASEVPGVAQFLQAYSTALGTMYGTVNEVESSLKDRLDKVNALLSDVGITPIEYPGLQTLAERRRAALDSLRAEKAKLEADLAAQTCDQAARIDPCKQRPAGTTLDTPDDTRRLVDQMTAKLRDDYTTLDQIAQIAFTESLQHAYARPRRESGEAQAAFDARLERWNDTRTVAAANLKTSAAQRDAAKTAWEQAVVDDVAQEAAAKRWSDAQIKLFDECFPDYVGLRKEVSARAAAGNPAANPGSKSQKDCGTTGGMAGTVENVACQDSR